MLLLLKTFLDIGLWRKGPQDLPASRALTWFVFIVYIAIEFVRIRLFNLDLRSAAIIAAVDVLMLSLWLWLVLAFFGHRQRFIQTITATLGVGVLILSLDILVRVTQLATGFSETLLRDWLLIRFFILALIMGRIFMHAIERGLMTGMALTIAIIYSTEAVAQLMLNNLKAVP